jgi:hypothetical protein
MAIIDLANIRAIVEADGKVRCISCIDGENYRLGCEPAEEVLISASDIENPDKLFICDYCQNQL